MHIYFKPYPPLAFPGGQEGGKMEIPNDAAVAAFLQFLDERGLLGGYGPQGVFVIVENGVVQADYILREGQTVKVLLQPQGG